MTHLRYQIITRNTNFADVPSPWSSEGLFGGESIFFLMWQYHVGQVSTGAV